MFTAFRHYLASNSWLVQEIIVLLITLAVYLLKRIVFFRLRDAADRTQRIWDSIILASIDTPLAACIWLIGVTSGMRIVDRKFDILDAFIDTPIIRSIGFVLIFVWVGMRFIRQTERVFSQPGRTKLDATSVRAMSQVARVAVLLAAILVVLQTLNVRISGILAFGGASTLIVGLAAREVLSNFFGGLMIFLDRPFQEGDWIRSPDREIEGTVEYIGWRLCRIRTFDRRPLYVPNSVFSTISVENPSRMLNRRIRAFIGIRYDDYRLVNTLLADIETMLRQHKDIDQNCTLMVNLVRLADFSLEFMVYTFTKTTDGVAFQAIQQDVLLKILEIIDAHGAECAFPTQMLHVPGKLAVTGIDLDPHNQFTANEKEPQ